MILTVIVILVLFVLIFLLMILNRILSFINRSKLKKVLRERHPEIKQQLGFSGGNMRQKDSSVTSKLFFKMLFTFGSEHASRQFWNRFVDIKAIEETEDTHAIKLIHKSIKLESSFAKIWLLMIVIIVICSIIMNTHNIK